MIRPCQLSSLFLLSVVLAGCSGKSTPVTVQDFNAAGAGGSTGSSIAGGNASGASTTLPIAAGGVNTAAGGSSSMGGTSAAISDGGGSSAGLRSRVVVMDVESDRFAAYDAEGQLVHDYRALFDFGSSFNQSALGWFEYDLMNMTLRRMPDVPGDNESCYDSILSNYYAFENGVLRNCDCVTAACTDLATPPAVLDPLWYEKLLVSPKRGVIGVEYSWGSERDITDAAPASLYTAQGALITTVVSNEFVFDRLDQVAIGHSIEPAEFGRYAVNLSSGRATWLSNPKHAVIAYE